MSVFSARGLGLVSGAISPFLLLAHAAHADIQAQEVWADWQSYMAASGYEISATESLAAGILTVTDIQLSIKMPEVEDTTMMISVEQMKFEEMGDGTVNIAIPSEFPMGIKMSGQDGGFTSLVTFTHDGNPIKVSGDDNQLTYDYGTAMATFALQELDIQGADEAVRIVAEMSFADFEGQSTVTRGDIRSLSQKQSADKLDYTFQMEIPAEDTKMNLSGSMEDYRGTATATLPANLAPAGDFDLDAALSAGLAYGAKLTYGANSTTVDTDAEGESLLFQSDAQSGALSIEMSPDGLAYDVVTNDANLSVLGSDIPFPIALGMREMGMNLAMPLAKSDAPQDFGFGLALRDVQIPDLVWGLFDPTGELPHDPATLVLDLTGKAKLLMDLADEDAMASVESGDASLGELDGLTLNELLLSAVGAELSGTGDFTFDNSDLESFDGFPAPDGEANLKLVGANTLIDKLIAMGLVSDSDAMGARMMMGLFTTPGAGEDTLTSRIELREGGQVLANGQRLR